jgi:ornithine cyclodeaminase
VAGEAYTSGPAPSNAALGLSAPLATEARRWDTCGMSQLRLLDAAAVRALLPMERCIGLMRDAFVLVSEGRALQPIRQKLSTPDARGLLGWMPGWTAEPERLGVKVISIFPEAVAKGVKSHQGVVMLFDAEDGRPLALLEAGEITAIRTAAATAAATDVLAPAEVSTLALFGCGDQARTHLDALTRVRRFERVVVWARDPAKARAFCDAAETDLPIAPVASPEEAAAADVLTLVTGAPRPFFQGAWLRPGQHLNLVGSSVPTTAEVDVETVLRSRMFTDYRDSALALAGELRLALEAGAVTEAHLLGEVGEVILGRLEGRRSAEDITLFKSLGMAAEDLLSADWILREAERTGTGLVADW